MAKPTNNLVYDMSCWWKQHQQRQKIGKLARFGAVGEKLFALVQKALGKIGILVGNTIDDVFLLLKQFNALLEKGSAELTNIKRCLKFLGEVVHECTHAKDYLDNVFDINNSWEKRARFHERAWQTATGAEKDFETIEEMSKFITDKYEK